MIFDNRIFLETPLLIWLLFTCGTMMFPFGCDRTSGEQQGRFIVSGSEAKGVEGQIEQVVFARQRDLTSGVLGPKKVVLRFKIIMRFKNIKLDGNTCSESHGNGTSTFLWKWKGTNLLSNKPFAKELLLEWNRKTDLVTVADSVVNRENTQHLQIELESDSDKILMTPIVDEER